jgi:replicative DNA helicase
MNVESLIKRIEEERKNVNSDLHSSEGLERLQEVAATYAGEHRLVWSGDLLKEIKERPRDNLYPTRVPLLDEIIGGFKDQQLITVSAHSKHGKTAFGLFLLEQFESLNPVMIPLEQSNEEIVQQRSENGQSVPKFLSPYRLAAQVTVDWIENRVVEGIAKYNTKLVLIDHLGYIDDFGENNRYRRENLAYRIEMIMKRLKNMAKVFNVVVVLLTHIHQADETKPPTLDDLKNSSAIKQESDLVLMLWRKNTSKNKVRVYENRTMVSVMANRRTGKNGTVGLRFEIGTGRFVEDNEWVASLMREAEKEVQLDDEFSTV